MIALSLSRNSLPPEPADAAFAPWTSILVCWLVAGSAALLALPPLRAVDAWFGWLPFWLIVAPAIDLAVLRHRWIAARLRDCACRLRSRRRSLRRQARPTRRRSQRSVRRPGSASTPRAEPTRQPSN